MKQNPIPKIYGLLGHPIKHSLSPAMHTAAFKKLKINAAYLLFDTVEEDLAGTIRKLRLMRVCGFNVTVPYKEKVMGYLDSLDELAKQIGAVNTVLNKKGRLIGYNTDAPGFLNSLKNELRFSPKNKNILIIGAGGAARAIGFGLAKEGTRSIVFYDLAQERAIKLTEDIKKIFSNCATESASSFKLQASSLRNFHLLVNASTSGMHNSEPLAIDPKIIPKNILLYDIVYNPTPTRLVREVKKRGIKAVNGLGMLLNQGALSFEIWTGRRAPRDVMKKALIKELKCRGLIHQALSQAKACVYLQR